MERISLGAHIGTGSWRECYEVAGDPTRCAKVVRDRYMLKLRRGPSKELFPVPYWFAALYTFGVTDMNRFEMKQLDQMSPELKAYTLQNVSLAETDDGREALVSDRVVDYDGETSKTLAEIGPVPLPAFWEHMERAVDAMQASEMQFLDLENASNVIVQKISPTEWRPVFIDVKYAGWTGGLHRRMLGKVGVIPRTNAERTRALERHFTTLKKQYQDPVSVEMPRTLLHAAT